MTGLLLIGMVIVGAALLFGPTSFVVGVCLLVGGVVGLLVFAATAGGHRRPGETGTVVEERHYIGHPHERDRRHW